MIIDKSVLKEAKVVLFGAGNNGRNYFDGLTNEGFSVAYFVDNNKNLAESKGIPVYEPEILLNEDKPRLKIIITPDYPIYQEIEDQLTEMGLAGCIFVHHFTSCLNLLKILKFHKDYITFCGIGTRFINDRNPQLPYMDTAEQTVDNFLQKRDDIINELNSNEELNVAKPCKNCPALRKHSVLNEDFKIVRISVTCSPTICQSKCIYCQRLYDVNDSEISQNHKRVAEIIRYIKRERGDIVSDDFHVLVASGEIAIVKHKDIMLDSISDTKALYATNAFVFDIDVAETLKTNNSSIMVSLDSGTKKTFALVKGHDKFALVIENLKKYLCYGDVCIKYIIVPGINDSDEDVKGIMNVLELLGLKGLITVYGDFYIPHRTVIYSISKFFTVIPQAKNSLFNLRAITVNVEWLKQNYPVGHKVYEQRLAHFREVFYSRYRNNYQGYKDYIFTYEIGELLKHFSEDTRFIVVDTRENERVVKAFEQLGLLFDTMELSSINGACEPNSIFVINKW